MLTISRDPLFPLRHLLLLHHRVLGTVLVLVHRVMKCLVEVIRVKTVDIANLRTPPCVFVPRRTEEMNVRVPRVD